jgi:hypothetical protein
VVPAGLEHLRLERGGGILRRDERQTNLARAVHTESVQTLDDVADFTIIGDVGGVGAIQQAPGKGRSVAMQLATLENPAFSSERSVNNFIATARNGSTLASLEGIFRESVRVVASAIATAYRAIPRRFRPSC